MKEVSVVCVLYNSELSKVKSTLKSILNQREVDMELIICDDGSQISLKEEIMSIPELMSFGQVMYLERKVNAGTVKNCLMGIEAAKGEYVYPISPGDYFYNPYVLRDLYRFAKEREAEFCFGNAKFYSAENGELQMYESTYPKLPWIYRHGGRSQFIPACSFLYGNQIIGAAYFRKTQSALEYMKRIEDQVIYVEDTPTTALYLLDRKKLHYYNQNIVWYEYGSGISTQKSERWEKRLRADAEASKKILFEDHTESVLLKARYEKKKLQYFFVYLTAAALKCLEAINGLIVKRKKKPAVSDVSYLKELLNTEC